MHPEYAARYRELYEKHWWWRAREDLIIETLDGLAPAGQPAAILDVGCGDGLLFEKLQPYGSVEGIEMDPIGIDPQGPWVQQIRVRPFDAHFEPGRRYDLVLMLDVLEHFEEPVAPLRRAVELLSDNGAIVVTVPAFRSQWTSHDDLNRHFTRYTRRTLDDLAGSAGARIEHARYFFFWTSPIKLAWHWKEILFGGRPAAPRIPRPAVNAFLYRLSRLEQRLFGGRRFPFGSSLLAVMRRDTRSIR